MTQEELANQARELSLRTSEYALTLLKTTIEAARKAFDRIAIMNYVTFGVGIALFTLAALSGILLREAVFTAAFGSLGVVTYAYLFFSRPIRSVQTALSNLLQAEAAFINFYDQLHFWAPQANTVDIDRVKIVSEALQKITAETMRLLEIHIEKGQEGSELQRASEIPEGALAPDPRPRVPGPGPP